MMDWKIILWIVLLAVSIGVIWFFTIKDIIKHIRYLKSQEITNRTYNDNRNDNPKPDCMGMVKNDYVLNSQNQAKKCQDTCRSNRKTNNKLLIGKFHKDKKKRKNSIL